MEKSELLKKIENCPIIFDPRHDHDYGTKQPEKVVLVPGYIMDIIKDVLK